MTRNLDHRVEVVFPIEDPDHIRHMRDKMLDIYLQDNTRARVMQEDGSYRRLKSPDDQKAIDVQEIFMNDSRRLH